MMQDDESQLQHIHRLVQQLRSSHQIQSVINTSFYRLLPADGPIVHGLCEAVEQAGQMELDYGGGYRRLSTSTPLDRLDRFGLP